MRTTTSSRALRKKLMTIEGAARSINRFRQGMIGYTYLESRVVRWGAVSRSCLRAASGRMFPTANASPRSRAGFASAR